MQTEPATHNSQIPMALLRIVIGWHFLYEGVSKVVVPGWTSAGFLKASDGPLAGLFQRLASDGFTLKTVDQLNVWGLVLVGLALMLGLMIRPAALSGIVLLSLYYLANPPLIAPFTQGPSEGNYLLVNKNLIEMCALAVVLAFPANPFGLETLLRRWREAAKPLTRSVTERVVPSYLGPITRRSIVSSLAGIPFLGGFVLAAMKRHGYRSFEELSLTATVRAKDTFVAGASLRTIRFSNVGDLKGRLPVGKIGNVALSRMILGGNLIGGWAHARDLIYVDNLVKAYHHRDKVFETFALAERCGVNTVLTNPALCDIINDYWRRGGRIQFISDCGHRDVIPAVQKSIDRGASVCYISGGVSDRLIAEGQIDLLAKCLELIRKNKLPAGVGAHKLKTVQTCVEHGLRPDFWMKTLHRTNYWSAAPRPEHDNIWCDNPEETVAYMRQLEEPWIAFKVLAAGALRPKEEFRFAFESGADFICVGMYDFQMVEDVNLALDVLNGGVARQRRWCA